MSIYCPITAS